MVKISHCYNASPVLACFAIIVTCGSAFVSPSLRSFEKPFCCTFKYPFAAAGRHSTTLSVSTETTKLTQAAEERSIPPMEFESFVPYKSGHVIHKTKNQVFTSDECRQIVQEAEEVASASEKGWYGDAAYIYGKDVGSLARIRIIDLPKSFLLIRRRLTEQIYPLLREHQFGTYFPDPSRLMVTEAYVIKYDAERGLPNTPSHFDGAHVTVNIMLNPSTEYDGGGTWFSPLDDIIRLNEGEMVSYASSVIHAGEKITRGKRYLLVLWCLDDCEVRYPSPFQVEVLDLNSQKTLDEFENRIAEAIAEEQREKQIGVESS